MKILKNLFPVLLIFLQSCQTLQPSTPLYDQLGGRSGVEQIVDHFINEIGRDPVILDYFKDSNIDRFRQKMFEHLCFVSGGPCQYTGDTMIDVHTGMQITESDFNRVVDLLINAMTQAGVVHPVQNQLLARLAPMRSDILER